VCIKRERRTFEAGGRVSRRQVDAEDGFFGVRGRVVIADVESVRGASLFWRFDCV
jgi:hypothetical protein